MIVLLLIVLGLVLGSFIHALVWGLHSGKDWVKGRSQCPHCHHQLAPVDLVPVFSWVFLRGKCRYCHKKIEDNPLVELVLPALFVLSYVFWPVALQGSGLFSFAVWLIVLVGLMALAVYDLKWMLLPDKLVFPLAGLALVYSIAFAVWEKDFGVLVTAGAGVLILSGLFYLLFQLSKGTWIGGGDVKLGLVLGLLAGGVLPSFLLLFVASLAGMIVSLPLLLQGKAGAKTQLPFGPFLIAGLIVVKLFGADIIDWYSGLFYV